MWHYKLVEHYIKIRGVGKLELSKQLALEGQTIVHKQSLAPPMLCLLRGFRRPWLKYLTGEIVKVHFKHIFYTMCVPWTLSGIQKQVITYQLHLSSFVTDNRRRNPISTPSSTTTSQVLLHKNIIALYCFQFLTLGIAGEHCFARTVVKKEDTNREEEIIKYFCIVSINNVDIIIR